MAGFFDLFQSDAFMPHGMCYIWLPEILYMHVGSDIAIALAYSSIPVTLLLLVRRRPDLIDPRLLVLFGAFILLCGLTHAMGVWVVWNPDYAAQGLLKVATALVSLVTAVVLWVAFPTLLQLPSFAQMRQNNKDLADEVAKHKETEKELVRTQRYLGGLLDTVRDGIIACDADGNIRFHNRAVRELFDVESVPSTLKEWAALERIRMADGGTPIDLEDLPMVRAMRGETVDSLEFQTVTLDGNRRVVLANGSRMIDQDNNIMGSVVTWHDDTDRRSSEEHLVRAQKMEAVGQLTGGIAHDFNNLLTVVSGNLELLIPGLDDDSKLKKRAKAALRASAKGAELTSRLLAFSRRQALAPEVVDVNALIEGMIELMGRTLGDNIELDVRLQPDPWLTEIDAGQLENSILNLAINARDAMPEGGRLTIETSKIEFDDDYVQRNTDANPGPHLALSVSDTGTGIAPDVLQRVFEPFYTTKQTGEGTGLGLAMVYGFVKQSGGSIGIYSELGHGTTVRMFLPRSDVTVAEPREATSHTGAVEGGSETVLLVEDNPDVAMTAREMLLEFGYNVLEAIDGPSAIAVLESNPDLDLMLTDIVMPGGMDGAQLARKAREAMPGLKVVYASGYTRNGMGGGIELDPDIELVNKPFSQDELGRALRRALDQP